MLYVALLDVRDGTEKERAVRRVQWQIPEGINVKAEYWLHTSNPQVIFVFEADSYAAMMQVTSAWDDVFDVSIVPAIDAKEGLEMIKQMME